MMRPSIRFRRPIAEARWLCVALLLCAASRPAFAGDDDETVRFQKARKLSDEGLRYYDTAQYDRAIKTFQEAYVMAPIPGLLFNLAQAYRLKGDCALALGYYQQYLEHQPRAFNRAQVERYEAEMRDCIIKGAPPQPPPPAALSPPPVERHDDLRPAVSGSGRRTWGLVLAGTGIAAAGAGVYFGLQAGNAKDELTAQCKNGCDWNDPRRLALDSDGRLDERLAIVLFGAGGALVVTGGILYYLGWSADRGVPTMAAAPGGTGWVMGWHGTF